MSSMVFFAATEGSSSVVDNIAREFGLNFPLIIAQAVIFLIVVLALRKFAFAPVLGILEERQKTIAEGLENAKRQKEALESAESQKKDILYSANVMANKMVEEARTASARIRETESQKAISQAEETLRKAREAAEAERRQMVDNARKEIGGLVVQTVSQVTGKVLTEDDKSRLVAETVNHVG